MQNTPTDQNEELQPQPETNLNDDSHPDLHDEQEDQEVGPVPEGVDASKLPWRVAKSLERLRAQINAKYPSRSKASDGGIGDERHMSRNSDHNAWIVDGAHRVVTARDFTNDPAHGLSSHALAQKLIASRDPRIKYIISNGKMARSYAKGSMPAWSWQPYSGSNPHDKHCHISVKADKASYDSTADWKI